MTRKDKTDKKTKRRSAGGKGTSTTRIPRRPQKDRPIINPMSLPSGMDLSASVPMVAPVVSTQVAPAIHGLGQGGVTPAMQNQAQMQMQMQMQMQNVIPTLGQSTAPEPAGAPVPVPGPVQVTGPGQVSMQAQGPVMRSGSTIPSEVIFPGQAGSSRKNITAPQQAASAHLSAPSLGPMSASLNPSNMTAAIPSYDQLASSMTSSGLNATTGLATRPAAPQSIPPPSGLQLDLSYLPPYMRSAAVEYDVFASELTFNSKEIINNLTHVAHENPGSSLAIATVIVQRIITSPPERKLPLLYLMDSICKNVGEPYISNFSSYVSRVFLNAYRSAGQSVRASMQRLLNTWIPVFGTTLVDSLRSACIPLDASAVSTVHINPAIARTAAPITSASATQPVPSTMPTAIPNEPVSTGFNSHAEAETEKLVSLITTKVLQGTPPKPEELTRLSELLNIQLQDANPAERQTLLALQSQVAALTSSAKTAVPTVRVLKYPVTWKDIKSEGYRLVVKGLYDDLEHVSKTDGMRFSNVEDLRSHMDWVFKQNRRKRARVAGSVSRCWYDSFDTFLDPEGSSSGDNDKGSTTGEVEDDVSKGESDKGEESRVPASGETDEKCPVCFEKYESVWDDEKQCWMLRDAKIVEGVTYHVKCAPGNTPRILAKHSRDEDKEIPAPDTKKAKTLTLQEAVHYNKKFQI